MSGGSYNYVFYKIAEAAETMIARSDNRPERRALAKHLTKLADLMHTVEWAASGDFGRDDDLAPIREFLGEPAILASVIADANEAKRQLEEVIARAQDAKP